MTEFSRSIVASQSHRRTVDPMSFRRWDAPFSIHRASFNTASPSGMVSGEGIEGTLSGKGSS